MSYPFRQKIVGNHQNGRCGRDQPRIRQKILTAVLKEDVDPVAYCKEKGFDNKIDMAVVDKVIDEAIQNNAQGSSGL